MARPSTLLSITLAALILAASTAFAELPAARMTAIFPPGGRAGSTFQVTVSGSELGGAKELLFSRPGISAKPIESDSPTERTFTVTIDSAVPVGACDVRFRGAYGVSNPRAFVVSDTPEQVPTTAGDADPITPLVVRSTVNARARTSRVDTYAVPMLGGQHVLFEVEAGRIDSKLSPVMVLHDDVGHEFERSRRGGLLDFTAPADGAYTLEIHDVLYRGGADYFYRLSATVAPHLDAIFPPMGQPGLKAKYTLYGRNLPGGCKSDFRGADGKPLEELETEIELPASRLAPARLDAIARAGNSGWALDAVAYRLESDKGMSNPVTIGLASAPVVLEQDRHDTAAQAQPLQPPVEVAGRFYPHGDRGWYSFDASKGDVYAIEVISQRMGLPTNPSVLIQRVIREGAERTVDMQELTGNAVNLTGVAFRTSTRDGFTRFDVSDTGVYRLLVRDLFNASVDNAALMYRLSIRALHPDFQFLALPLETVAPAETTPSSAFLRKGGSFPIRLQLARQEGFSGAVQIHVEGLPAGISCPDVDIPAGQNAGLLVLTASDHAGEWCGPVHIVGRAKVKDQTLEHEARIGAVIWPSNTGAQELAVSRLTEDFVAAVSDEPDAVSFIVEGKPLEVAANSKLQIPVRIQRNMGFNTPVKISTGGLATVAAVKELTLAPDVSSGTIEFDPAALKLGVGTYSFFLQAEGQASYPRKTVVKGQTKTAPQPLAAKCYSPLVTVSVRAAGSVKGK